MLYIVFFLAVSASQVRKDGGVISSPSVTAFVTHDLSGQFWSFFITIIVFSILSRCAFFKQIAFHYPTFFLRTKTKGVVVSPRVNDELLTEPPDNVWFLKDYKRPVYSFAEALGMIREVYHPTVYNQPKSLVNAYIELDLRTAKKVCNF